jgi:hypothetical protein
MKTIKSLFLWAFFVALLLGAAITIRPYWNRYWIHRDMETSAIYGTKNSVEATMEMLLKEMHQEGYDFTEQDFIIDKEPNKKVTITLHYTDRIGLFSLEFMKLPFTVTASATEIKEYY